MEIYPTLYRYNAPYRGPRDFKEINKVLTSIGHDIGVVEEAIRDQKESIDRNLRYYQEEKGDYVANIDSYGKIQGIHVELLSQKEIRNKLNSMSLNLDRMIANL